MLVGTIDIIGPISELNQTISLHLSFTDKTQIAYGNTVSVTGFETIRNFQDVLGIVGDAMNESLTPGYWNQILINETFELVKNTVVDNFQNDVRIGIDLNAEQINNIANAWIWLNQIGNHRLLCFGETQTAEQVPKQLTMNDIQEILGTDFQVSWEGQCPVRQEIFQPEVSNSLPIKPNEKSHNSAR